MKNILLILMVTILGSCNASTSENMENDKIIKLVKSNNLKGVKEALEGGTDVNTIDSNKRNLLLIATLNKQNEMAKLLVEKGADVNMQANNSDSAFLYAGASGQTELVKLFLANGARFDLYNRYGGTALIPACERGYVETVRVLSTTKNYPINHVNRLGWTALVEAVILGDGSSKFQEVIKILIDNGADKNIADFDGVSALQHAKNKRQTKIVEILESYK